MSGNLEGGIEMKLFKSKTTMVDDYDKVRSELIRLGWLVKIYNVEMGRSIYDTTDLGYQYYFAICMEVGYKQLFKGPKLVDGQFRGIINENIDLVQEGYVIEGIDAKKLTPRAADYLYVLTDSHGSEITNKKQTEKKKQSGDTMEKVGRGVAQFMKGVQTIAKSAQQYDKSSTRSTRSAWGTDNSNFPPKRTLGSKKRKKSTRKSTKKRKYKR